MFTVYPCDGDASEKLGEYATFDEAVTVACALIEQSTKDAEDIPLDASNMLTILPMVWRLQEYGLVVFNEADTGIQCIVRRRGCPPWCEDKRHG